MYVTKEAIEEVRRRCDLVQVVEGRGVILQRKGKNDVGLCPFHEDREPSLVVNPEKQLWHCFGTAREPGRPWAGAIGNRTQQLDLDPLTNAVVNPRLHFGGDTLTSLMATAAEALLRGDIGRFVEHTARSMHLAKDQQGHLNTNYFLHGAQWLIGQVAPQSIPTMKGAKAFKSDLMKAHLRRLPCWTVSRG